MRGRSPFASIGLAAAATLLVSLGASALWAGRTQATSLELSRTNHVRSVADYLAQSVEIMIAGDELSAMRRIIAEESRNNGLSRCRVVLPDGQVIADAVPSQITLTQLPPTWPGAAAVPDTRVGEDGQMTRTVPLRILGRGQANLEVSASVRAGSDYYWPMQAGIGAITVLALAALLLLHRVTRSRLRGIWAVRQALLGCDQVRAPSPAMAVNPTWGLEAKAWNNLLQQMETQRKRTAMDKAQESLQGRQGARLDLDAACDALSQGLILVGEDLRIRYANGAAGVLLQARRQELVGSDVLALIEDPRVQDAIRTAASGPTQGRTIVETRRTDVAGAGVLRFVVRPVRREDRGIAMIIVEDITQQRVAEDARNAFVAQATHELRTPLTNIRLYAESALDEGKDNPAVRANCLNIINQEARRLDRMVGDILSVAEIEAGTLKLRRDDVRLEEVFSELRADYAAQARDKQIELVFNLPPKLPVIQADRDKLALSLHNLIGNALKYTPSGGKVTVTVTADRGRLAVDVADTGIGISSDDRSRLFEKFYRARDARVAKITGSGLGLAISREVLRLHGGDITVESELDKGSTFTLMLPITEEAA